MRSGSAASSATTGDAGRIGGTLGASAGVHGDLTDASHAARAGASEGAGPGDSAQSRIATARGRGPSDAELPPESALRAPAAAPAAQRIIDDLERRRGEPADASRAMRRGAAEPAPLRPVGGPPVPPTGSPHAPAALAIGAATLTVGPDVQARRAEPAPLPGAAAIDRAAALPAAPAPRDPRPEINREIRIGDVVVELGEPLRAAPPVAERAGSLIASVQRPAFRPWRRL
jgi:hypothetical protein